MFVHDIFIDSITSNQIDAEKEKYIWTEECKNAFEEFKNKWTITPMLTIQKDPEELLCTVLYKGKV